MQRAPAARARRPDRRFAGGLAVVVCDDEGVLGDPRSRVHARARREDDGRAPVQRGRPAAGERLRDGSPPVGAPGARRRRSDGVRRRQPVALLHSRPRHRRRARRPDRHRRGDRQRLQRRVKRPDDDPRPRDAVLERTGSSSRIRWSPTRRPTGGFEELGNRRPDCSAIERLERLEAAALGRRRDRRRDRRHGGGDAYVRGSPELAGAPA